MLTNISTDELRKVFALKEQPEELLQWLLDHGELYEAEEGTVVMKTGEVAEYMMITLEGKIDFYMDVNGRLVYFTSFGNTKDTGGVGGVLPYSRMKTSPGTAYAMSYLKVLRLHKSHFPEMERLFPDFIQLLIGFMTERARLFATTSLQHEKVNALGKLAAGIAHELNNPAAAINRIASELRERLDQNYNLTENLIRNNISPESLRAMLSLASGKENAVQLSALQRMETEDEISDWLESCGLSDSRKVAETFTEAGYSINDFEQIRDKVDKKGFIQILHWLENLLSSERLMQDLDLASGRISKLVSAIKSHVHMDRSNDMQCCTNIHADIENTLTLLGYKLREKNIRVNKNFQADLPEVEAFIGELNQVWTNLIDNAIFALEPDGEISISTHSDKDTVTIEVADNGSGIPQDIISRIFDPFFTTKKVGQGTGIGLDMVKRIIGRHNGEIKASSVPGKTEFTIHLPMKQKKTETTAQAV